MYQYRIDCWVPPKSGWDLLKKNEFIKTVESTFESMEEDQPEKTEEIKQLFNKFIEEGEGYVLDTIIIESDTPIQSINECEQKIMPLIRQKNPYAKLVGCVLMPVE